MYYNTCLVVNVETRSVRAVQRQWGRPIPTTHTSPKLNPPLGRGCVYLINRDLRLAAAHGTILLGLPLWRLLAPLYHRWKRPQSLSRKQVYGVRLA